MDESVLDKIDVTGKSGLGVKWVVCVCVCIQRLVSLFVCSFTMLRTVLKRSVRLYSTTTNSTSLRVSAKEVAPTVAQAPNRATTWSENQRAKHVAMSGPRFEQMTLEAQVDLKTRFRQIILG